VKHLIVGVITALVIVGVFTIWALLATLLDPIWALGIMGFAFFMGAAVALLDYTTEGRQQ
jgi:hypothetical protein